MCLWQGFVTFGNIGDRHWSANMASGLVPRRCSAAVSNEVKEGQ